MKRELYMSLLAVALLTGCGSDSIIDDDDGDDGSVYHNPGSSCASCHSELGNKAEGKSFRSGVTVYTTLSSSTPVDGYLVRLLMDDGNSVDYKVGRGRGNANSGLYDTALDGYSSNSYTVQLLNSSGTVVKSSGLNTHDSARLDCNSCHRAVGLNNAPGEVTPETVAVVTPPPPPATGPLSFATDVMPVLENDCKSCHGSSGSFTITTASTTYSNITALTNGGVDTTTPENSYLLQKSNGQLGHGGGTKWAITDASYITVKTWITEGALNN